MINFFMVGSAFLMCVDLLDAVSGQGPWPATCSWGGVDTVRGRPRDFLHGRSGPSLLMGASGDAVWW